MSFVRSRAEQFGIPREFNRKVDEDHFRSGLARLNLRESRIGPPAGTVLFSYPF